MFTMPRCVIRGCVPKKLLVYGYVCSLALVLSFLLLPATYIAKMSTTYGVLQVSICRGLSGCEGLWVGPHHPAAQPEGAHQEKGGVGRTRVAHSHTACAAVRVLSHTTC